MIGSEKQIAWAEKIKAQKLTELDALIAKSTTALDDAPQEVKDAISALRNIDDARYWIDNRDCGVQYMLKGLHTGDDTGAAQRETDKLRRVGQRI